MREEQSVEYFLGWDKERFARPEVAPPASKPP